ncbi:MAG: aspartate aminotransferase family protein, partial [Planctomycetes bacterium]|nr:aspartate aminotransferase family protein [Planctomycetota bacterium]
MSPEEFRRHGRAVVDWIADYWERVEELPVQSRARPGELRAALPAAAPEDGEPFEAMMADVDRLILPGITHWQSPNFFGYFPANSSPPAVLGELLSAGLGVQGMLWSTSPACTELETHVLDWLVGMLGLPERFRSGGAGGGVIQDTASSSTLCALLAARERAAAAGDGAVVDRGGLVYYCSDQAHSSVEKAARIAGVAPDRLRVLPSDADFRLPAATLRAAVEADLAAGLRPAFLCATVGTTSSNAVDPVAALGEICAEHRVWLHVDAAMSGTAALCEEFRWIHDGLERADSYCFNPHKWMFTNFDCDCFWV